MNHIYRSIWNRKTSTFVAVSELVKNSGGASSPGGGAVPGARFVFKTLALSLLLGFGSSGYAQPTGGVVVAGSASIVSGNGNTTINQASQNAVLNWQSFSIGAGNSVNFVQPNSNAVALNRVLGSDPSNILGSLSANGKVFLLNPNGILFGQGAQVNVGGLVASTLNISDSDFMAGNYKFAGAGNGSVLNQGAINAAGGYVALLGAHVSNQGTINARLGTVALAAGDAITLDVAGDGLLNVAVNQGAVHALVQNGGLIQADGGQVLLSAQGAGQLLQTAVNNTGIIQAHTLENHNGTIKLLGDMQSGTVNVGGTLDASAPQGGNGGFIETSAAQVQVQDGARITTAAAQGTTGTWLIDPTDFTIAAGSGALTSSGIGADTLSSNLGSNNVRIETVASGSENGDIHVNSAVNWSANKLTLSAHRDININASLNGSGTAKLALEYGQAAVAAGNTAAYHVNAPVHLAAGDNFSTKLGSDGSALIYMVITSLGVAGDTGTTSLQGIRNNLAGRYVLGSDIDASATSGWNGGAGFNPIGTPPANNVNINHFTGTFDGLGHTISNLTVNRPTTNRVGLFGQVTAAGNIRNIGLLGGSVTGDGHTGSLVGYNEGTVSRAYATGTVTGSSQVGGLVGNNVNKKGTITQSFATGQVSGSGNSVGGLVGFNGNTISQSYATGAVINTSTGAQGTGHNTGGLVGQNYFHTTQASGKISQSYATGAVTSNTATVGGLVGGGNGAVNTSYWNTETTGLTTSVGGGTGLSTTELIAALPSDFATSVWGNGGNQTTPYLLRMTGNQVFNLNDLPAEVTTVDRPKLYTAILDVHQLQAVNTGLAGHYVLGNDIDASAAAGWNGGAGFAPIGGTTAFTGILDGLGHTISGLTINRPGTYNVGLFGKTGNGSAIRNLGLLGGSVSGGDNVGGLVGSNDHGTLSQVYATGAVTGTGNSVGGLVGFNSYGTISQAYATGAVSGASISVGGLVGYSYYGTGISQSYATGAVSGNGVVGGLVGQNVLTPISKAYATGTVTGTGNSVGGLVGFNNGSAIMQAYATGAVSGNDAVGGLVGQAEFGTISEAYATGAVSGASNLGGLAGTTYNNLTPISTSYWDSYSTGQAAGIGNSSPTGISAITSDATKSAAANYAFKQSAYAGFSFTPGTGAWFMVDGSTRPFLQSEYSTTINNAHQLQLMAMAPGASYTLGSDINAANTGLGNDVWGGTGFSPISTFSGSFDGRNHVISGITINQPKVSFLGLFAYANSASRISNVGLIGGSVNGSSYSGSLVGRNEGVISNSYSTANVNGGSTSFVGGLVGWLMLGGTISNSYAAGTVTSARAGGLVGRNEGTISNSYASGAVTGANSGGLTGLNDSGVVTNSFWNIDTTGRATSAGGTGLTTAAMMQLASFSNWNIANTGGSGAVWRIYEGHTTPLLRSFMTDLAVTANNVTTTYNGTAFAGSTDYTFGTLTPSQWLPSNSVNSSLLYGKANTTGPAINAGGYALDSGLYSGQRGYDIAFTAGTLTINRAALAISSTDVSKTYDGTVAAAGTAILTGGTLFGSDSISGGNFAFTDKNAGNGNKTVTATGVTVNDGNGGGNYNVSYADNTTSTITPAVLSASLAAADKTYDGSTLAAPTLIIIDGLVDTETINVTGAASFNSKDVASANLVTVNSVTLADGGNGGLAGNYTLAAGQTTTAHITPKALTVDGMMAANKVYDGTTAATLVGGTLAGLVSAETLAFSGQSGAFADKNVGVGKAVTVSGITLADGTGLASNYRVSNPSGLTADIARLNSVAWVGGLIGNWFDPANWANGAVPDLANVANVVIPAGVSINFNQGDVASPAQAGPVDVDSIDSAGGLSLVDGSLNVARGLQLASLDQSGGALNVIGNTVVGSFSQSGGAVANTGNFTATGSFHQSGGTLAVSGNVGIAQASGSAVLGNITAGTLGVTAADGDITQVAGSHIVSGSTTLAAPNGNITLATSGNSLGTTTASGANITRTQSAIAAAVSVTAMAPSETVGAPSLLGEIASDSYSDGSGSDSLAGLNVTVIGQGVNVPLGM